MPRRPKAKNTLSAGERAALYEAELAAKIEKRSIFENNDEERPVDVDRKHEGKLNGVSALSDDMLDEIDGENKRVRPKKKLLKPEKATVNVDFSLPMGEIKPLHGMCNGPVSYGADLTADFREIGVPFVRFDCTDTAASAYAVDVSRIFRDFGADPGDPDNYDFSLTDKYVEAARLSGARIIYRLGESEDILGVCQRKRGIEDIDVLCRVCINIIRHFNDRFAGGYELGIEYFELWNEGTSDVASDFEAYRRLANAVKLYNEDLKVGGISCRGFEGARDFLRYCNKNHVPLDFVTVDLFSGDLEEVRKEAEKLSKFMMKAEMADVEIIVGKWSYADQSILDDESYLSVMRSGGDRYAELRRALYSSQRGIRGAAYAAALLVTLNSFPMIFAACHYDAEPVISPFCSVFAKDGSREKPFYSFNAYGKIYKARARVFCEVQETEGFAHSGIYAAAALGEKEAYVLLASFGGCGTVDLRLDGISDELFSAEVYMLDGVKNLVAGDTVPLSGTKKRMVFNLSEYGVMLVKLF